MEIRNIRMLSLALLAAPLLGGCYTRTVRGSGEVVVDNRQVSDFDSISLEGVGRMVITQGNTESLSIETDDNLLGYIESEVDNGVLELTWDRDVLLRPTEGVTYRVSLRRLVSLHASGAGSFELDQLDTPELAVDFSGAGKLSIDRLTAGQIDLTISGAGEIQLAGSADTAEVTISGIGRYQAPDLESQRVSISISGGGDATVWATDRLDLALSGLGEIGYYGDPTVSQEISGGGRIVSLGTR